MKRRIEIEIKIVLCLYIMFNLKITIKLQFKINFYLHVIIQSQFNPFHIHSQAHTRNIFRTVCV